MFITHAFDHIAILSPLGVGKEYSGPWGRDYGEVFYAYSKLEEDWKSVQHQKTWASPAGPYRRLWSAYGSLTVTEKSSKHGSWQADDKMPRQTKTGTQVRWLLALGFPRVIREIWRHQKFYGISSLPALNLRLTRLGRKLQGAKQKPPIRSWLVIRQGRCLCVFISPCPSTSSWSFHECEVLWIARPASSELAEKQLTVLPYLLQNHIHR